MKGRSSESSPKKRSGLTYSRRKSLYGYGFISLWLVGTVLFFIIPLIESIRYSFSEIAIKPKKLEVEFVGLKNYIYALNKDPHYTEYLAETLKETLWKTPLIIISLFIAVVLNQKFKGRGLARAIFFLPVIIVTGPVFRIISGDMDTSVVFRRAVLHHVFTDLVGELLEFLGIYGTGTVSGAI